MIFATRRDVMETFSDVFRGLGGQKPNFSFKTLQKWSKSSKMIILTILEVFEGKNWFLTP